MPGGAALFIVFVILGLLTLVIGITTFLWLPLLIIGLAGLFGAPLWGLVIADADDMRQAAPRDD